MKAVAGGRPLVAVAAALLAVLVLLGLVGLFRILVPAQSPAVARPDSEPNHRLPVARQLNRAELDDPGQGGKP